MPPTMTDFFTDVADAALCANNEWVRLVDKIHRDGRESAPRGLRIRELLCCKTKVSMASPIVTVNRRKMGYRFLAAEAWCILTGKNDVESIRPYSPHIASFSDDGHRFDGAYGPRVVDQLRYVVDTLACDRDSRQAVLEIWRPNPRPSKDIPCTLTIQWMIRDGYLHCFDTMRSSDAWLGWVYDVFNFSMLSAYVALMLRERGVTTELGTLHLVAGSSHLYIHPEDDGAKNVPYGMKDVQEIVDQKSERDHHQRARVLRGSQCTENCTCGRWFREYAPIDLGEFDSPASLLVHLEKCRDRQCVKKFMSELYK